jgi:hypothetical protein
VTLLSFAIILSATLLEFIDYRTVHTSPSLIVDKSRGEKLTVDIDITFPRVPCYRAFDMSSPGGFDQASADG